jgi:hypothetical protein
MQIGRNALNQFLGKCLLFTGKPLLLIFFYAMDGVAFK